MLADYHIHTSFSGDSTYPMEDVVKRAIKLGINEICITDHVDYFVHEFSHLIDYKAYVREYRYVKDKYKDAIAIKLGIEFGVQSHTIASFARDFSQNAFDFVILSNHQVDDKEFWSGDFQWGKTQAEYNRIYYEEIFNVMSTFKQYSVLGHLDMVKRYDQAGILDDAENEAIIKKILRMAIADGKGIEVNTSCFRYRLPDLTPSRTILQWYLDLGGEIITIGSDSHAEDHLGYGIGQVKEALKKMGYRSFCTFDQMRPLFHAL